MQPPHVAPVRHRAVSVLHCRTKEKDECDVEHRAVYSKLSLRTESMQSRGLETLSGMRQQQNVTNAATLHDKT